MNAITIALHIVAAVIWVGGMFFAYVVLRPSGILLDPPQRLQLWAAALKRFFLWVWVAIAILMLTGYWQVFNWFNGFSNVPAYVHVMHVLGWIMTVLFVYLYFKLYPPFIAAVKNANWPDAAAAMNRIRQIVLINLVLGITLLVAVSALQRI